MMDRLSLLVTLIVTTALSAAACGSDSAPRVEPSIPPQTNSSAQSVPSSPIAPAGQLVQLTYTGGQVTGATGRVPVKLGSKVTLQVTSDVAEEVHLHGYDRCTPVGPGAPAALTFTANIPGVFEVELEQSGVSLTQLEVS